MIDIIYKDNDLLVCIKPAGVNSTNIENGLPDLLRKQLNLKNDIRTVHRLDQVVSGLMVVALNKESARILSKQITDGEFRKIYLAIIKGKFNIKKDILKDNIYRDPIERKSYVSEIINEKTKYAELEYFQIRSNDTYSLLKIKLKTGRTHQIRCQLSSRGHPIVGDKKYDREALDCNIALWSNELTFTHPSTGKVLHFVQNPFCTYPWSLFI